MEEGQIKEDKKINIKCEIKGHENEKMVLICVNKNCEKKENRILCLLCINEHSKQCFGSFSKLKEMVGPNDKFQVFKQFQKDFDQIKSQKFDIVTEYNHKDDLLNNDEKNDSQEIKYIKNWFFDFKKKFEEEVDKIQKDLILKISELQKKEQEAKLQMQEQIKNIYDNSFLKEKFNLKMIDTIKMEELRELTNIYIQQTFHNQKDQIEFSQNIKTLINSTDETYLKKLLENNVINQSISEFQQNISDQITNIGINESIPARLLRKQIDFNMDQYLEKVKQSQHFSIFDSQTFKFDLTYNDIPDFNIGIKSNNHQINLNLKNWTTEESFEWKKRFSQVFDKNKISLIVKVYIKEKQFEIDDSQGQIGCKAKFGISEEQVINSGNWQFFIKKDQLWNNDANKGTLKIKFY